MKLLRLATTLNSTSAPYNQFSLGFKQTIDQTFCSLMEHNVKVDPEIKACHAGGSVLTMLKVTRTLVARDQFDVIHIHSGITGIILIIALFPFRLGMMRRTVFTLHNSWSVLKIRNQILNLVVMLYAKRIYGCGEASRESIPKIINFFVGEKTDVIVNGFDDERVDRVAREHMGQCHFRQKLGLKIVYVGALNNTKNQIALLDVLAEKNLDAEIVFLGDGVNRRDLEKFARKIPHSCTITFKGRVSRDVAIEHMLEADVCISLSKGEGLPIAVLEAMYAGCFLILSSIPPHTEIGPPSGRCLFVEISNREAIEESLDYVVSDIVRIRATTAQSKDYAQGRFSVKSMLSKYKNAYISLREK